MKPEKSLKTNKLIKPRKKRPALKREFIVTETFNGTRKLADLVSELIYAEYCRRLEKERKNNGNGSDNSGSA